MKIGHWALGMPWHVIGTDRYGKRNQFFKKKNPFNHRLFLPTQICDANMMTRLPTKNIRCSMCKKMKKVLCEVDVGEGIGVKV